MPRVVEINQIKQLADLRLSWQKLFNDTRGASFFQTLDWLLTYWQHFGHDQRLRTLLVESGGELIGILPLTVIKEQTRLGKLRTLTYPLHDWGWFYGPIGPNPTATLIAGLQHIAGTARDWDRLDLRWVDSDRVDHGRTPKAMEAAGFSPQSQIWKQAAVIDTSGSWDEYLSGKGSRFGNKMRRAEKQFAQLPEARFERFRPCAGADLQPSLELYDECVDLAARSWQGKSTTGTTLSHAEVRDFLRQAHQAATKLGMVDICQLRTAGRLIGFGYNYHHNGVVSGLRVGTDPTFRQIGLGSVLYSQTIRDSFDRGDQLFDVGPGYVDAKQKWLTSWAHSYHHTHFARSSPRSQLLRLKGWWQGRRATAKLVEAK